MEQEERYIGKVKYLLKNEVRVFIFTSDGEIAESLPREYFPKNVKPGDVFRYTFKISLEILAEKPVIK